MGLKSLDANNLWKYPLTILRMRRNRFVSVSAHSGDDYPVGSGRASWGRRLIIIIIIDDNVDFCRFPAVFDDNVFPCRTC